MSLADVPAAVFQGVVPTIVATTDGAGVPNATYVSQLYFVDERHVALSCQFFNKTKRNVLENPLVCALVHDPRTFDAFRLRLRYLRSETDGALFDRMSARIEAIASHTGMSGIFKLRSADVYEVLSTEAVDEFLEPAPPDAPDDDPIRSKSELASLQLVSVRASRAKDLDDLLSGVLGALEEGFGFEHSMVLLHDETTKRLTAIASRGYGNVGAGAEVGIGDGLIGTVARERCILRVAGVGEEIRYGRAIRATVHRQTGPSALRPEIPLPGLVDAQSQMAMPLVAGDRLVGVIAVESRSMVAFDAWDEAYLEIVSNQVAVAIDAMLARDAETEPRPAAPETGEPAVQQLAPSATQAGVRVLRLRYFKADDCVFVGDDYLVRNMPGRILWRLLRAHRTTGRTEFSNRELRLDATLGLPAIRDNLESRLVLLRKRLEQKCPDIRLVPTGRGLFRLAVSCPIELDESGGA